MNISFEYLYRDTGNFKKWGEVIFSNKNNLDVNYLERQVRSVLIDKEFFVAKKASVPNLQFQEYIEALDHGWHEFYSVLPSVVNPNDPGGRDILEFIESLRCASEIYCFS